jgi:site-specific DNA-methyltransferase (adenine-specific)
MRNEVIHGDCMEVMRGYPDKHFSLCIADPPYGIGHSLLSGQKRGSKFVRDVRHVDWDVLPSDEVISEMFRVSRNQIIWGGNYFALPPTRCNLIWDKVQEFSGADFELAWTSFDSLSKAFRMSRVEAYTNGKIHPTQKPVKLYDWILKNYAKEGDTIFDPFLGSGSSRIAAHRAGLDFIGAELDPDYWAAQEKRYKDFTSQLTLF